MTAATDIARTAVGLGPRAWRRLLADSSVGSPGFVDEYAGWDDEQRQAADQIRAELRDTDLVRVLFCDPHGIARSKTLTAPAFRSALRNGMDFSPGPFVFDTGHAVAVDFLGDRPLLDEIAGAGDFVVVPDPRTYTVLPNTKMSNTALSDVGPRTALVIGDEFLRGGARHPLSSRDVLRRVEARYAAGGLAPVVGLEIEWYLTRRLPGPPGNAGNGFGLQGQAPAVQAVDSGYQFNGYLHYDAVSPVTDPLAALLTGLGFPLRSMEHESGPGQVESTFEPLGLLAAGDAMLLFRTLTKQECTRAGYHASFMSLPQLPGADPSGWHLHQSAVRTDTGENVFAGSGAPGGLSPHGSAHVSGLLARAAEYCLLSVPTVNGYRRLAAGHVLAPTRVRWEREDRSAMVRVLGGGAASHVENRIGEPCANPYLAMAAQLSAGLDGVEGLVRDDGSAQRVVPQSLAEALAAFRAGTARDLLGEPLARCLELLKQSEADRFAAWCERHGRGEAGVTDWEQREYFESF